MSHTAKLVEARDRVKALAMKRRDASKRAFVHSHEEAAARSAEADGMDVAVRVLEDLLQD